MNTRDAVQEICDSTSTNSTDICEALDRSTEALVDIAAALREVVLAIDRIETD